MKKHKIKLPRSCTKFPEKGKHVSTASYIKAFDRLNLLKSVRYVNDDHN